MSPVGTEPRESTLPAEPRRYSVNRLWNPLISHKVSVSSRNSDHIPDSDRKCNMALCC